MKLGEIIRWSERDDENKNFCRYEKQTNIILPEESKVTHPGSNM
jgi:hypothetical protein